MLEFLKRREDWLFERFCEALAATDQRGVLTRYFQQHRVCCYEFYDIIAQLQFSVVEFVAFYPSCGNHC